MRRWAAFAAALCLAGSVAIGAPTFALASSAAVSDITVAQNADGTVTVTDMAGREVTFAENPEKVFSSSPASEAWLCALVPERMIGWANTMSEDQLAYYPASVAELPLVGGWYGYTEGNAEGIITMAPDVVISAYNLTSDEAVASAIQDADELSTKLGTPVLAVSYVLDDAPEVMRLLGAWLGVAERGAELADFMQAELDKVADTVAAVPADEVLSYYYAEDASGLMTESADSFHAAVFAQCGLTCAADVTMSSFMGREQVSLEQIINWDPEVIFVFARPAYETITTAPEWADIAAVKDGRVYLCPSWPQNWYDRSPNPLRVLGSLYTAAMCYPDYVTYDLDEEVASWFKTLYNVELTDKQIQALYA